MRSRLNVFQQAGAISTESRFRSQNAASFIRMALLRDVVLLFKNRRYCFGLVYHLVETIDSSAISISFVEK